MVRRRRQQAPTLIIIGASIISTYYCPNATAIITDTFIVQSYARPSLASRNLKSRKTMGSELRRLHANTRVHDTATPADRPELILPIRPHKSANAAAFSPTIAGWPRAQKTTSLNLGPQRKTYYDAIRHTCNVNASRQPHGKLVASGARY